MRISIITTLIFFLTLTVQVFADDEAKSFVLSGRVLEKETREPIVYANIGIEGTFIGTASNAEGFFEFKIPGKGKAEFLYVSAVGYSKIRVAIEELKKEEFITLEMEKQSYDIKDVSVQAQSKVAYRVLRETARRIPQNYLNKKFSAKAYYNNSIEKGRSLKIREAIVELSDSKGYVRETPEEAYKNRNYQFIEASRNFEVKSIEDGNTRLDELLEFDIVRNPSNILEVKYLNYFDLNFEEPVKMDNDSVWVIAYNLSEPFLSTTGDFYATSYKGRIFIRQKDYVVLKNETWITSSAYNRLGRSLAIKDVDPNYSPVEFYYDFKTTYRQNGDRYSLDHIVSNRTNKWTDAHGTAQKQTLRSELMFLETNVDSPLEIQSRDYIEDTPTDDAFWSKFIKPRR